MSAVEDLKNVNFDEAEITLWVFKKPQAQEGNVRFSGAWVETKDGVDEALQEVLIDQRARIEEVEPYGLLAQNNEGSALSIPVIETHAGVAIDVAAEHSDKKRAKSIKKLRPAEFYVIKIVFNEQNFYAFRKADKSWKTKKSVSFHFSDETLAIDPTPSLDLSPQIDFFVVGDEILILNKANFESILMYREAHKNAFDELKSEAEFTEIFASIEHIDAYVGTNKIQLRRANAIQQKAHYKDEAFMERLRKRYAEFNLTINFDEDGKIIPCENTCKDIFQALLDHRLSSGFSESIYDVPNATKVAHA
ncbi:Kiwa anti-phage protein KwaB-like domain-containing protein [Henriciella sp.]|uniref:Kiwa anti-phage protein KwaB-like domain-containing protein n=1 Tax=Henriciella sp. TaxID=1968823 RepID=UPI0025BEFAFE|nr:Kiwa anti-phage protein KwaB-like domain-containing protein [Henriciella sp.]